MGKTVTSAHHTHPTGAPPQRQFAGPSDLYLSDLPHRAGDAVLDQLFYATRDECLDPGCRPVLLDRIADDAVATRRLVDWACLIASELYGGLPAELIDEKAAAETLFHPPAVFCRLAAEYHERGRIDGAVYDTCDAGQRREAAATAVALVSGFEVWWTDFLYQ
ncbi:hypothetical protein ACFY97_33695 [Streptomyces klenkii]|uniref:hypothetical protein n=1 Tax=Streptomyces klenkii TaxID=1420899 RepID=UPI0036E915B9